MQKRQLSLSSLFKKPVHNALRHFSCLFFLHYCTKTHNLAEAIHSNDFLQNTPFIRFHDHCRVWSDCTEVQTDLNLYLLHVIRSFCIWKSSCHIFCLFELRFKVSVTMFWQCLDATVVTDVLFILKPHWSIRHKTLWLELCREGLRLVIVALTGLFSYLFWTITSHIISTVISPSFFFLILKKQLVRILGSLRGSRYDLAGDQTHNLLTWRQTSYLLSQSDWSHAMYISLLSFI